MRVMFLFAGFLCLFSACSSGDSSDDAMSEMFGRGFNDRVITKDVYKAIRPDNKITFRGRPISVSTTDQVVTLKGTVKSEDAKERVVQTTQSVMGVKKVVDQLVVVNS